MKESYRVEEQEYTYFFLENSTSLSHGSLVLSNSAKVCCRPWASLSWVSQKSATVCLLRTVRFVLLRPTWLQFRFHSLQRRETTSSMVGRRCRRRRRDTRPLSLHVLTGFPKLVRGWNGQSIINIAFSSITELTTSKKRRAKLVSAEVQD